MRAGPIDAWSAVVRSIIDAVEQSDTTELDVRVTGLRVAIRRPTRPLSPPAEPGAPGREAAISGADDTALHFVRSPLTGVWYDAPSPGAAPFVDVGSPVEVGSVIGLIETMKIFNEVASDQAGTVRQVLVERGALVAAHAPLLAIEPRSDALPPVRVE